MTFTTGEIIGIITLLLGVYGYIPYFIALHRRTIKPHVFSWLVWTLITAIGFAAQVAGQGGPGAWVTGFTAVMCFIVTIVALQRGEKNITRGDWIVFLLSLAAIPLWLVTKAPLWSVILISVIDLMAFLPTFRKSWRKPYEENAQAYFISGIKFGLSLLALQSVTLTTALYPASLTVLNLGFVAFVLFRRHRLKSLTPPQP